MAKDPAFLFYSKDWIEGTAELMPAEKGVYVDLLCYQHQKGSLPTETMRLARLVGLPHDEFLKVWEVISPKFVTNGERTYNQKLNTVMTERSTNAYKNKIIGIFSAVLRKSPLSQVWKEAIKKEFKINDFLQVPSERINERINEWYNERYNEYLRSLVNANEDEDANNKGKVEKKEDDEDASRETGEDQQGPKPLDQDEYKPLSDEWFDYIFDEVYLEQKAMTFKEHDIGHQLKMFKSKVIGAPADYIYRETDGIRKAFDYQLRNSKPDKKYDRANNKGSSTATSAVIEGGKAFGNLRPHRAE